MLFCDLHFLKLKQKMAEGIYIIACLYMFLYK